LFEPPRIAEAVPVATFEAEDLRHWKSIVLVPLAFPPVAAPSGMFIRTPPVPLGEIARPWSVVPPLATIFPVACGEDEVENVSPVKLATTVANESVPDPSVTIDCPLVPRELGNTKEKSPDDGAFRVTARVLLF